MRGADAELYERLLTGDFCYVLTARQMGKSSLMASTAKRLEGEGVHTAIVDLTRTGTERGAVEGTQWYFGVTYEIHKKLGITELLRPWWQERADLPSVQRLTEFFREMVLATWLGRVVIFIDEIDSTIGLPFADDFFAAIRACHNARATDPAFERLTFALLGVASPDQLIRDTARTPFNIGYRIDLTDFTPEEACPLADGLHPDPEVASRRLDRVLHWTGGHPYLTQALCRATEEKSREGAAAEAIVDPLVEDLFLSSRAQREETNLRYTRARLAAKGASGREILRLYQRVRGGRIIADEPTSPLFAQLKLSGIVKVSGDANLAVRNRIYELVFTSEWAKSEMPTGPGRQLIVAGLAASLLWPVLWSGWSAVFYPRIDLQQILAATDDFKVASEAYVRLHSHRDMQTRADELMAEYWDRRAMREALREHSAESLLSWLKAIQAKDTPRRRKEAQVLAALSVGPDTHLPLPSDDASNIESGHEGLLESAAGLDDALKSAVISPDGRTVLTDSYDKTVRIRTTADHKLVGQIPKYGKLAMLGPDGLTALTCDRDLDLRIWNTQTGRSLRPHLQSQTPSTFVGFGPDASTILVGEEEGEIELWSTKTGLLTGKIIVWDGSRALSAVLSPDHKWVLASTESGAQIWNRKSGELVREIDGNSFLRASFSPAGDKVLIADLVGNVRLWNARTGALIAVPVELGQSVPTTVAFSPNGDAFFLASGRWLHFFSLDKDGPHLWANRYLSGRWTGGFRFLEDCPHCLQVVLAYKASYSINTIHFDEPSEPSIQGEPEELLAKWQDILALQFGEDMKFVRTSPKALTAPLESEGEPER